MESVDGLFVFCLPSEHGWHPSVLVGQPGLLVQSLDDPDRWIALSSHETTLERRHYLGYELHIKTNHAKQKVKRKFIFQLATLETDESLGIEVR